MKPSELRAIMDRENMTETDLADALHMTQGGVNHWLSGRRAIPWLVGWVLKTPAVRRLLLKAVKR